MTRRFISTSATGGVVITCPAPQCLQHLKHGRRWPDATGAWIEQQIERQVAEGISADIAARWVRAMQWGGLSNHEALWLIADRDCRKLGSATELVDASEVPIDLTHRDAWRRSHNGVPIWIDEKLARKIDEERMWRAYDASKS